MNIYQHGGNTFAVIDGELYVKATQVGVDVQAPEPDIAKRKGRPPGRNRNLATGRGKAARHRLTEEERVKVREDLAAGVSVEEVMEKHDISRPTIYRIQGNSGEPLKLATHPVAYICPDGHVFKSKFPLSHARCPDCRQLAMDKYEEPEVEEGEI